MAKLTFILGSLEATSIPSADLIQIALAASKLGLQVSAILCDEQSSTLDQLNQMMDERALPISVDSQVTEFSTTILISTVLESTCSSSCLHWIRYLNYAIQFVLFMYMISLLFVHAGFWQLSARNNFQWL